MSSFRQRGIQVVPLDARGVRVWERQLKKRRTVVVGCTALSIVVVCKKAQVKSAICSVKSSQTTSFHSWAGPAQEVMTAMA